MDRFEVQKVLNGDYSDADLHSSMDRFEVTMPSFRAASHFDLHSSMDRFEVITISQKRCKNAIYIPVWIDLKSYIAEDKCLKI